MKRVMTIAGLLLVGLVVSCREADTGGKAPDDDPDPKKKIVDDPVVADEALTPVAECEALLAAAGKADFTDLAAAEAAWDEVADALQNHMYTVDQARWLEMKSEVDKARIKILQARQKNWSIR